MGSDTVLKHLGVVMNLNLILKIASMERDRPYGGKRAQCRLQRELSPVTPA